MMLALGEAFQLMPLAFVTTNLILLSDVCALHEAKQKHDCAQ
jgi:hypothetical protein